MIIVITLVVVAFVLWFITPVAYILFNIISTTFQPVVPAQDRQTWQTTHDMMYNIVKYSGFIVMAAVAYYIWTIAQRKRAEDLYP